MRLLTVEIEESEFEAIRAVWAIDVELGHFTPERYLGELLGLGGRIRAGALQLSQGSGVGRGKKAMTRGTAWGA